MFKGLLTASFLMRACATHKPVNFIDQLFLCCTVPFSIKKVWALSLIPSSIALLLKGCLGLPQDLLHYLCGRFIDFQPFGFYGNFGHTSGFLFVFSSLLPTSLINLHAIRANFFWVSDFAFDCPYIISMHVIFV